jgi:hypothetical protein
MTVIDQAVRDALRNTIRFALKHQCKGLRWTRDDDVSIDAAAERIVRHIEISGYQIQKTPPIAGSSSVAFGDGTSC